MARKTEHTAVYEAIYNKLRNQIFSGRFRPGDLLPSENQLCGEFGASRETVRKGLKALEQEGLIFSRPKVGYFVSTPNHSSFTLTFQEEWEGCCTQYCDIHGILPDESLQQKLGIDGTQKVIELSQITRNANGEPVAYDIKFVPYERAYPSVESEMRYAVLPDITLSKVDSFDYYTDIEVSAVGAPQRVAQIMLCPEGSPMLLIERIFIRQDGRRIGYSMQYSCGEFGRLTGSSGHQFEKTPHNH